MESEEHKNKILQTFKDFLTRVAKLEELGGVGSRLLVGFQQALDFLRRSAINRKSELVDNIIKANETKRVKSYMAAGCFNNHDSVQNISKSKSLLNELENLLEGLTVTIKTANGSFSPSRNENLCEKFSQVTINQEEISSSDIQELEMTDYAVLMASIYCMVKQDFEMQKRIVTALNFKTLSGELESYCLMWSLRPFVNDEIMHQAWRLTH